MSIERIMYEEIQKEFEEMGKMELGSEQHVKTAQVVNNTMDRLNKIDEIKNETLKLAIEERKLDIEEERIELEKKENLFKHLMTGTMFVLSLGVTIWANLDSKAFETENTHTTEAGRASTRRLLSLLDRFK